MKSIIKEIATKNFPRFRLGVGSPEHGDLVNYVLGRFSEEELPIIRELVKTTSKAIYTALDKDLDKAMNMYNKK